MTEDTDTRPFPKSAFANGVLCGLILASLGSWLANGIGTAVHPFSKEVQAGCGALATLGFICLLLGYPFKLPRFTFVGATCFTTSIVLLGLNALVVLNYF